MDQYTFESLHNIVRWWEEAEKNTKLNEVKLSRAQNGRRTGAMNEELPTKQDLRPESREGLLKTYSSVFRILLSRKLPLSSHEIEDFDKVSETN